MNINITARHFDLTDNLREYVKEQVGAFKRYFTNIVNVSVIMNIEKHRYATEIVIQASGNSFASKAVEDDMYLSLDKAVAKMERQLQKYKDKLKHHKERKHMGEIFTELPVAEESFGEYEIEKEKCLVKPLLIEEAIEEMQALNYDALLFHNVLTGESNVIYKKADGKYGLIEPAR